MYNDKQNAPEQINPNPNPNQYPYDDEQNRKHLPPFPEKFPLPLFITKEEEKRILDAYEKDAAEVTRHQLSLGRWILGAVFDWCEVIERHKAGQEGRSSEEQQEGEE